MPKRIIILGSTGSIGCNALSVVENLPGEFEVVGLAAGQNWQRMAEQARRWRPRSLVLGNPEAADRLREACRASNISCEVLSGKDSLERLVQEVSCDFVLSAIVGVAGLPATLAAIKKGLTVGLANKESLVVAGELMVSAAKVSGATLIPVDSEHSAIFQSLHSGKHEEIERIFLTASGGPFRTWSVSQMRSATWQDALQHPTWDMGPKITIDSATMMNKALEIIEAKWLFALEPERIEVVIHPESIIHSMVAFRDGSVVAQMGSPDMRTPIQYALTYPRRLAGACDRLDFSRLECMTFAPPDETRFPALRMGHETAKAGGTAGVVLNAANETAVELFRDGKIGFLDIATLVSAVLERHAYEAHPDLDRLMALDAWARTDALQCIPSSSRRDVAAPLEA